MESVDEQNMQEMQRNIETMIQEFETGINQRIEERKVMVAELKKIQAKS